MSDETKESESARHTHTCPLTEGLCDHCRAIFTECVWGLKRAWQTKGGWIEGNLQHILFKRFSPASLAVIPFSFALYFLLYSFIFFNHSPPAPSLPLFHFFLPKLSFIPAHFFNYPQLNPWMVCSARCQMSRNSVIPNTEKEKFFTYQKLQPMNVFHFLKKKQTINRWSVFCRPSIVFSVFFPSVTSPFVCCHTYFIIVLFIFYKCP